MGRKILLKEAAKITGFSEWELRTGAKLGKYPSIRIGGNRGKIIFDLQLLEKHIEEMMLANIRKDDEENQLGKLRRIY